MKRFIVLFGVITMSLCLCACGGNKNEYTELNTPDTTKGFSVTNELRSNIKEFYISQSTTSDWGDDLLNGSTLDQGVKMDLEFSGEPLTSQVFDIAVIMEDDTEYQFKNIDIAKLGSIKLLLRDNEPVAEKQ